MPDPEWKQRARGEPWFEGETLMTPEEVADRIEEYQQAADTVAA